jgi:hypothetical protein
MLTFGSGKSGRCSRPETKTEPAKKKLESDFRGSSESSSSRVLAVVGKIQKPISFLSSFFLPELLLSCKNEACINCFPFVRGSRLGELD